MQKYASYNTHTLLQLLSQSDETAFTEIYNRYWQKLFVEAYSRLKVAQEAEDIVHDVFTSLWRNREKTEIISLDAYLATATKYTVLAKIKQRERYNLYRAGLNQGRSLYGELQAESAVHYGRILELAKKEIDKLPERCRLIFNYHRFEGKSARQIADLMNISQKTVENQLNKAVNRLKVVARTLLHSVFFLVPLSIILPCIKAFRVIC